MSNTALTTPLPNAIEYAETTHATYAAAIAHAHTIKDPAERMDYVTFLRTKLAPLVDKVHEGIEALVASIELEGWEQAYDSKEAFVAEWADWISIAENERKKRDNKGEAMTQVIKNWGEEAVNMLVTAFPQGTGNLWKKIGILSKEADYAATIRIVTRRQHSRIVRQQKSRRFQLLTDIRTSDIEHVLAEFRKYKKDAAPVEVRPLTSQELSDIGCYIDNRGMLCEVGKGTGSLLIAEATPDPSAAGTLATSESMFPPGARTTAMTQDDADISMGEDLTLPAYGKTFGGKRVVEEESEEGDRSVKRGKVVGPEGMEVNLDTVPKSSAALGSTTATIIATTLAMNPAFFKPMNAYHEKQIKDRRLPNGDKLSEALCTCTSRRAKALAKRLKASVQPQDIKRQFNMLAEYWAIAYKWASIPADEKEKDHDVCWVHARRMANIMGMHQKGLNREGLDYRFKAVQEHRFNLGYLKTHKDYYYWFWKTHRPARPDEDLGRFKYRFLETAPFAMHQPTVFDHVMRFLGHDSAGMWKEWERDGTINVSSIFAYLWDIRLSDDGHPDCNEHKTLGSYVEEEFDYYHHHWRPTADDDMGWQRNQFFSISQQLVWEDPLYYALYCSLRPDANYRLIAYSYYVKNQQVGDRTGFRHLDAHPEVLLNSRKQAGFIQGTVFLTDEDDNNCTELVKGFHKPGVLKGWYDECVIGAGLAKAWVSTAAIRIEDRMFLPEHEKKYGKWEPVPVMKGGARISMPHLPHGAIKRATINRRTIFPWYVAVDEAHTALENKGSGTWGELALSHMKQVSPPETAVGNGHRFKYPDTKFKPSCQLMGVTPIGDALTARRRYVDNEVQRDLAILLGNDYEAFCAMVLEHRATLSAKARDLFRLQLKTDDRAYGSKSFRRSRHNPAHQDNADPENAEEDPTCKYRPEDEEDISDDGNTSGGDDEGSVDEVSDDASDTGENAEDPVSE
ncbi:uncharacterized protein DFL_001104 [Arthrobotrys flagrans]|uniref:Uncharacterized protein n=1 Tax=Arthrobotrys flagrans TaxID=97331 RepID=A0A437AG81_ARTFL|nr:hypothetical protein DFL_001104 [Arthrobotrys flagrans]